MVRLNFFFQPLFSKFQSRVACQTSQVTDSISFLLLNYCMALSLRPPGGMFTGLKPLLVQLPTPNPYIHNRAYTVSKFQTFERHLQETQPTLLYRELLAQAYIQFASFLDLPSPSKQDAEAFGASIGTWPAHPDTVAALKTLKKQYVQTFIQV